MTVRENSGRPRAAGRCPALFRSCSDAADASAADGFSPLLTLCQARRKKNKMKKIVVTTPSFGKFNPELIRQLEDDGYLVVRIVPFSREVLLAEVADADALVVGLEKIDEDVLKAAEKLKVIAKHGVGLDNIDLAAAEKRGIAVKNAPGANTQAVADLTFGLMIGLARSIPAANAATKNGEWKRFDGVLLWEKTLGIVGLGAIGIAVAERARGFRMKILGYEVAPPRDIEKDLGIVRVPLDELLSEADFVTLHVPLTPQTRHMIGEAQLKRMKPGAYLINTARGGIVDEAALYRALSEKWIAGAGIDAFAQEPPTGNPLLTLENVIATPHMGAFTVESNINTSAITAQNVLEILGRT